LSIGIRWECNEAGEALYHPLIAQAIAELGKPPKSGVTLVCTAQTPEVLS
jgi:hypothetical protein